MTVAITSALITACIFSLLFPSTRWLSVACIGLLAFLHPLALLLFILIAGVAIYFIYLR